jgi:hypothetical protein
MGLVTFILKRVIIRSGSYKTLEVPVFLGIYSDLTLYLRIRNYLISFSTLFRWKPRLGVISCSLCCVQPEIAGTCSIPVKNFWVATRGDTLSPSLSLTHSLTHSIQSSTFPCKRCIQSLGAWVSWLPTPLCVALSFAGMGSWREEIWHRIVW